MRAECAALAAARAVSNMASNVCSAARQPSVVSLATLSRVIRSASSATRLDLAATSGCERARVRARVGVKGKVRAGVRVRVKVRVRIRVRVRVRVRARERVRERERVKVWGKG